MSEEKQDALAKSEETAVANVDSLDGISGSIDKSDISMSRITIIQPTSQQAGATIGVLFDTATGEEFEEINAVFLNVGKSRVRWDQDAGLGNDPLCRSRDGKNGEGDPGGNCAVCPYAQWMDNQKPECSLKYDFIGIDADTKMPFFLSLGGTSFGEGKKLITRCIRQSKKEGRSIPLYAFPVKITSLEVKSARGRFFKYVLTIGEEMSDEDKAEYKVLKDELVSMALEQQENEEMGGDNKNQNSGGSDDVPTIDADADMDTGNNDEDEIKVEDVPF
jgi:hypothetical protein